jgi:hypothetical protein
MLENWWFYIILAYIVTILPVIGKYFACLNTMFHEDGHAITAKIFGGRVESISLFSNTEGVASTLHGSWVSRVITSYAGYTFSSFVAYICFYLIHIGKIHWLLYFFIGAAIFNLVFWVRNVFGVFWLLSFIALCGALLYYHHYTLNIFASFFLSAIILTQSVSTAAAIMYLSFVQPRNAGDASNLARSTFIPSWVWGSLFFVQSVYIAYQIVIKFII